MSFNLSREAWEVKGLDAQARLVLLLLADVANEAGGCWPSIKYMAEKTGLGERVIRYRLVELTEMKLLSRTRRHRADGSLGTYDYQLHLPACGAGSPAACGAAQEPTIPEATTISSSLRSEEGLIAETRVDTREHGTPQGIAKEYHDWHVADSGRQPTTEFMALFGIAKRMLKSGYQHDEIVDAMKLTKVMNAKGVADAAAELKHKRDGTTNTRAVPASIVRAFAKCEPWFERRGIMQTKEERAYWMRLCATQVSLGYGPGEIMLRMAVALRANNATTFALSDAKVDRFNGELADYPDAMERAYTNRAWSAK